MNQKNEPSEKEESEPEVYINPYGQEDDEQQPGQKSSIIHSQQDDDGLNLLENYFKKKNSTLI